MAIEQPDRTHRIGDEVLQRVINKCGQRIAGPGGFNRETYGDFGLSLLEWRELLVELQRLREREAHPLTICIPPSAFETIIVVGGSP